MAGKNDLGNKTKKKERLSLLQFRTEYSGACQIVSMICDELARSYRDSVDFITVDLEKETGLAQQYGVRETPTILFIRDGNVIDYTIGLISRSTLISKIETALQGYNGKRNTKTS